MLESSHVDASLSIIYMVHSMGVGNWVNSQYRLREFNNWHVARLTGVKETGRHWASNSIGIVRIMDVGEILAGGGPGVFVLPV